MASGAVALGRAPALEMPYESALERIAAVVCSLAIASVPIFSTAENLSFIPQAFAVLGTGLALTTLLKRIPGVHLSMVSYAVLVLFWSITLLSDPEVWPEYLTLIKVCVLALACHIVFRSKDRLLLLFGTYCASGLVTLGMNWRQIRALGTSMAGSSLSEKDRFAGTFDNANDAGIYGVMLMLGACIVFFNCRKWWRWPLAAIGLGAGLAICFFSGSRKAMLGLGCLILAVPWMAAGQGGMRRWRPVKMAVLLALMAVLGGLLFSRLPFVDRLLEPFSRGIASDSSSELRFAMLTRVFELWAAHPLFGCGFEGFSRLSEFGVYSHTTFGEVLCNEGLVGMALLAVFYFLPGLQLFRMRGLGGGFSVGLLTFWAIFTIFSIFAVLFDSREFVPMYAGICGYLQERTGMT